MGFGQATNRLPRRNGVVAYLCFATCFGISLLWYKPTPHNKEKPSQPTAQFAPSLSLVESSESSPSTLGGNPSQPTSQHGASPSNAESHCAWRTEVLAGSCVGWPSVRNASHTTAKLCQEACCNLPLEGDHACVAWQFRTDTGCFLGKDTRLGFEKDGPSAWCEPSAPAPWSGQRLKDRSVDRRSEACGSTWNPEELRGQCFGLGARRTLSSETAASCRDACCSDPTCETWQWREDKGCFYGGYVGYCDKADAASFEPFEGQRRHVPHRTYNPPAFGRQ
eukprot:1178964-Prorocentrum_minimum.AAC.2